MECVICYEEFKDTNICVTPCGHKFCFNCMMKSLNNNNRCPCCRAVLQEEKDFDDESSIGSYEISSSYEDSLDFELEEMLNLSNNTNIHLSTPGRICEKFLENGYTMEDIVVLWIARIDRANRRYSQRFMRKLISDTNSIVDELDNEKGRNQDEMYLMGLEDKQYEEITIDLNLLFRE